MTLEQILKKYCATKCFCEQMALDDARKELVGLIKSAEPKEITADDDSYTWVMASDGVTMYNEGKADTMKAILERLQ